MSCSLSFSHGILRRATKTFIMVTTEVSAECSGLFDVPYSIVELSQVSHDHETMKFLTRDDYENIIAELSDEEAPYTFLRLIFTTDDNNVVTNSTYLLYNPISRQLVDYVMKERDHQDSIHFARFVLFCETLYNDLPSLVNKAIKKSRFVKAKATADRDMCNLS